MLKTTFGSAAFSIVFLACATPTDVDLFTDTEKKEISEDADGDDEDCVEEGSEREQASSGGEFAPGGGDPSSLPKCACEEGGAARCVTKSEIPASFASSLGACDDGAGRCVPDKLIASKGAAPKTCKSIIGDGRCMSLCIPRVSEKKDILDRGEGDACDEDELCVPCVNPLEGNESTGVCEIGESKSPTKKKTCASKKPTSNGGGGGAASCPYEGAPVDVEIFPSCGSGGRCVPEDIVPEAQRGRLASCEGGLCAPEKSVAAAGMYLPPTCRSVGNVEGRCLSKVIKDIAAQSARLERSTCEANELCAPCFSPLDGSDTGACRSVSCDAPKEPARSFASCCGGRGRCVPEGQVTDPAQKEKLGVHECAEDVELCAPIEDIDRTAKRPSCTGTLKVGKKAYTGACVSTCLDLGIQGALLDRGSCDSAHLCAPCVDPLGRNTGACE